MSRFLPAAAFALLACSVPSAYAQTPVRSQYSSFPSGVIEGRVLDDKQAPVAGATVSVLGRVTAVATTDRNGRYALKDLPLGPYIVSARARGYWRSRGRTIQLTVSNLSAPEIQLARVSGDKTPSVPAPAAAATQLAGVGGLLPLAMSAPVSDAAADSDQADSADDGSETAWRMRHLPRSILKDSATEDVWVSGAKFEPRDDWFTRSQRTVGPAALFSDLALSGQINLLTIESFDRPGQLFGANGAHSVAFVSVGTQATGGVWAMQGAMTQGDLPSWIVAGSYKSIDSASHAYDVGWSYSTQRYDGGNAAALAAMPDNARNVGAVYGYDRWTVSPRLVMDYGAEFARYDYLNAPGLWSPRLGVTVPLNGFRLKATASRRAIVPGAEEFAPAVTGVWLPPQRTFSSVAFDGMFRPEHTSHMEVAFERDFDAGVTLSVRGFGQRVNDQLVEIFGVDPAGSDNAPLGHYLVGNAGDMDVRGWGVGMTQEVPGYLRSTVEYSVASSVWGPSADAAVFFRGLSASERLYDLQTLVEATIPQTATRIFAKYRINTAFGGAETERLSTLAANARFNVRVNQSLPFLRFSNADWEALVDVRNLFRDGDAMASFYDEALAVRAPKRIVGGLLVKF